MNSTTVTGHRASVLFRRGLAAVLCTVLLLLTGCAFLRRIFNPTPRPSTPMYRVVDLGATAPNGDSEAFSINNASEVVGWVRVGSQKQATLWKNIAVQPVATALWTVLNDNSIAYAINASNEPVGWATGLPELFPSKRLWIANVEGRAYSINDNSIAVGWTYLAVGASSQKAVLFNDGKPILPGAPIGAPFDLGNFGTDNSRAYDVNRARTVVGAAATASGPSHAFRHVGNGKLQPGDDLGTLGGLNSEACGINASDQVAGWSQVKLCAGQPVTHAFLWTAQNRLQDLGTPYPNLPMVINDPGGTPRQVWWASTRNRSPDGDGGRCITDRQNVAGQPQIVGYSELHWPVVPPVPYDPNCIGGEPQNFHRAFMWDGTMHDLNDLIPPNSGWYLLEAWGINDHGQIVGRGRFKGQLRAFALLP